MTLFDKIANIRYAMREIAGIAVQKEKCRSTTRLIDIGVACKEPSLQLQIVGRLCARSRMWSAKRAFLTSEKNSATANPHLFVLTEFVFPTELEWREHNIFRHLR
jgi:hypothetical protein